MKTNELIAMLDRFEASTGKPATKIICGAAAFEELHQEAQQAFYAERYLEPNYTKAGYIATFMGIPVQVIRNPNILENDKFYIVNDPVMKDAPDPLPYKWWRRSPNPVYSAYDYAWGEIAKATTVSYGDNYYCATGSTTLYKDWLDRNLNVTPPEKEIEIDEYDLMSVLNGGGFDVF